MARGMGARTFGNQIVPLQLDDCLPAAGGFTKEVQRRSKIKTKA